MAQQTFSITFQTGKHIRQNNDGFGFFVSNDEGDFYRGTNVAVTDNGTLIIATEVVNMLGLSTLYRHADYTVGRQRYFTVNDEMLEEILDSASYERRSEREEMTAKRNISICEWLIDILS